MSELAAGGSCARDALGRLFRAYGRLFERRLERMGLEQQAADVAQGLWLEIARAAPRYRGDMPVRIFLLGFLKMARRRHFFGSDQQAGRQDLDEYLEQEQRGIAAPASSVAPPKAGPEWFDFERCVRRALARFESRHPSLYRLLLLRHVEELSLEEMIAELGGSTNRAKAELFSARAKMAPLVRPCLELWPDRTGRAS